MNMDDQKNVASAPIIIPPVNRTVITIPKAVASMTTFPTREDYKDVVDANMEKKRRKDRGSFLGNPEEDPNSERRRSSVVTGTVDRRRARQTRPSTASVVNSGPPKLKIKIGNSIIGQDPRNQDDSRIRPPKKRLSSISSMSHKPSIEDLKRESMKFRRMIMAGFDSDEQPKVKSKKDKNGKRKKRQNKKEGRVQILEDGEAPPKLIIRLGKSKVTPSEESESKTGPEEGARCSDNTRVDPPPFEPSKDEPTYPADVQVNEKQPADPSAALATIGNVRSAKVTPIRLKLTRCHEGYELKAPAASSASEDSATANSGPSASGSSDATRTEPESESASAAKDSTEKSSNQEDTPLLTQPVTHNSPGYPPAPLPQGCQVR